MFKMCINTNKLPDSMCYDSGTTICIYTNEHNSITIEVRGRVRVVFKGQVYRYHSDMPEELQRLFTTGEAYSNNNINIQESNWYEVCCNDDEDCDVAEEINGRTPSELEQYCKNYLKDRGV